MSEFVANVFPTPELNRVLAAMGAEVRERILPHLELVSLPSAAVLYEAGAAPPHAYFPIDSLVALRHTLTNGTSTEIALIGSEGVLGITSLLGGHSAPRQAVVLRGGLAYRLSTSRLQEEFDRHGKFLLLLLRYTQSLMTQIAQAAVCNRHHPVDRHLCSWLLFVLDRLPANRLDVTQELIANMLGVRRESIAEAAHALKAHGAIDYARGHIAVVDRCKLERLACECYAVVKKETDRLLPAPAWTKPDTQPARGSTARIVTVPSLRSASKGAAMLVG